MYHPYSISIRLESKPIATEMLYDRAGLDERFEAYALQLNQLSPFQLCPLFLFLIYF
ncbi:hypothetical protein HanPSC8_Chr04g0168311 [Helianthus annuus]|nr:hypothetical protein HanPSC8_Chr04g0168311 [Helianthus annuus]